MGSCHSIAVGKFSFEPGSVRICAFAFSVREAVLDVALIDCRILIYASPSS